MPKTDLNLPFESSLGCVKYEKKFLGKAYLKEWVWVIENGNTTGCYIPIEQLRTAINETVKKVTGNPSYIDRVHKKTTKFNHRYFEYAEKIYRIDLSLKTNKELIRYHTKLWKLMMDSHLTSLFTTWFIDSNGEDYSKYLQNMVQEKIAKTGSKISMAPAFSILTSPKHVSLGMKEEQESLKIVDIIKKNSKLKKWFLSSPVSMLVKKFEKLSSSERRILYNHYQKWHWFPYTYIGPAYTLDYYLQVWSGLIRQKINPEKELKRLKEQNLNAQKKRALIIKELRINRHEKHLFDIAADIVWIKGYRKDCFFHGFFVMDLILKEIGRRTGMTLMQTKFLIPEELPLVLNGQDFTHEANERYKFCVVNMNGEKVQVLHGDKARKVLRKIQIEKVKKVKFGKLEGTCACPGKAKGTARIVNTTEDMSKMKKGNIMVSINTYPALVPAMKKAAAIVTQDGGITCHAAIVSRELQTPCVVGCKIATAVLKDGDMVEVDADRGVVKIL